MRKEIERLRPTVTEQAVVINLAEGRPFGLSAGPVPSRVDAKAKAGLLDLVYQAG